MKSIITLMLAISAFLASCHKEHVAYSATSTPDKALPLVTFYKEWFNNKPGGFYVWNISLTLPRTYTHQQVYVVSWLWNKELHWKDSIEVPSYQKKSRKEVLVPYDEEDKIEDVQLWVNGKPVPSEMQIVR